MNIYHGDLYSHVLCASFSIIQTKRKRLKIKQFFSCNSLYELFTRGIFLSFFEKSKKKIKSNSKEQRQLILENNLLIISSLVIKRKKIKLRRNPLYVFAGQLTAVKDIFYY